MTKIGRRPLWLVAFALLFSCTITGVPIEISSNPDGASIKIDGVEQPQTTPAKIRIRGTGRTHIIQVGKEGYYTETDTMAPLGGGMGAQRPKTSFHFELTPLPSQVVEQLNPSSLKIDLSDTGNFLVGVMDVRLSGNIPKELQVPVTNAIISELVGLNRFKVIDRANRDTILKELASQMAACPEGECSVAEVGRLIGVNRMAISYISLIGNKYYITITIVNVETGFVEALSESAVVCEISELPMHVKKATRELFK